MPVVLVVEDDAYDQEILAAALSDGRGLYELLQVTEVEEAEAVLFGEEASGDESRLRLVLLDLHLARSDGRELLQKIRSHPSTALLPIVVFSSSSDSEEIEECYRLGANSYVVKPTDFERFCHVVRTLIAYWTEMNEVVPLRPTRHVRGEPGTATH